MNLHHLAIFHAVSETGSISAAATRLHISQPAVSRQLSDFEHTLGTVLFDRLPRGMRLTRAGELLAGYAQRIFALDHEARARLAAMESLQTGQLALGASTTIGNYLLPDVLAGLARNHPGLHLTLDVGNTADIQQRLLDGSLDLALTEGFAERTGLDAAVFRTDELVVVAAPEFMDASHRYGLAELAALPWIMREPGSGTRAVLEQTLADSGLAPTGVMALASTEAIKRTVAAGAGIAVVSALTVRRELARGELLRIDAEGFPRPRPLHRLLRRYRQPDTAMAALLAAIEQPHHELANA